MSLTNFIAEWSTLISILVILVSAIVLKLALGIASKRIVKTIVSGVQRVKQDERMDAVLAEQRLTQRTKTIASVLDNFATWAIAITALVMTLSELGINVGALIAVSTVLGAAIGFGAQSLVKDILSGIFIVFEDQYGVGDWVEIGSVSGEVERVGLRVTEVRDIHGTLWFVRNGEIIQVGNASQEWAAALLDFPFAYENDVDQVQQIIQDTANKMRKSKQWSRDMLADADIWGMQHVSGEQFVVRVSIKTLPNRQWAVSRELRKLCKQAFDSNNINLLSATKINMAK
ncbi:mechanosensitive ion channel family protein [Aquiluna sp.]|nr:mechanosensitive ion channel family protein [Aquiluna sp.]MDA7799116.1 mechanosensitive ion channel family protein [Aquiluna sp.]MDB4018262.1 mechanosensitive ion channel family protein [Aquiluna sp.]MDB4254406.1 mechanosensitive ion channel family protein [Aquiluna sp.]